jgi:ribosome assembly protein YihI (activator of Der GTPase)
MAKAIEIDEDEFNRLKALQGVAAKIVANPSARKMLEQAHKTVDPNAPTPFLDQEEKMSAPIKEMEKAFNEKIAAMEKDRADEKREQTLAVLAQKQKDGFSALRRQGYTDEGVAQIEKLMETKGLLDVDDAVAIFEKNNPPATPSSPSGGMTGTAWGFADVNADSDKSIQELIASKGQNEHVADKMAMAALNEFRAANGRR